MVEFTKMREEEGKDKKKRRSAKERRLQKYAADMVSSDEEENDKDGIDDSKEDQDAPVSYRLADLEIRKQRKKKCCLIHFRVFLPDFNLPKRGSKSTRNPPKGMMQLNYA